MRCEEARDRLVAWDDRELSPGEASQVDAHVRRCPACAARAEALRVVTPRPVPLAPPSAVLERLRARVDTDAILTAVGRDPGPPSWSRRLRDVLDRDARVPMPMVLAYAALLALAVSLAVAGWWGPTPTVTVAGRPAVVPSEAYEPASFTPAPEDPAGFR